MDDRDTIPAPPVPTVNPTSELRDRLEKENLALRSGVYAALRALNSDGIPSVIIQQAIFILEGAYESISERPDW